VKVVGEKKLKGGMFMKSRIDVNRGGKGLLIKTKGNRKAQTTQTWRREERARGPWLLNKRTGENCRNNGGAGHP